MGSDIEKELVDAPADAHAMERDRGGRISALALGGGVVGQKNTPAKLVAVAYGVDRILVNERQAVEKLGASYDLALEAAGVADA